MKQLLVAVVAGCLLTLASCSNGSNVFSAGTWTYKGTSYNAYSAVGSSTAKSLLSSYANVNTHESDNVECFFYSWPPTAGTYTIVNTQNALAASSNKVYILMNIGMNTYTLDNGSSSNTAIVTVNSSGKIGISVPNATFSILNPSQGTTDSGPFTLNVTQNL